MAIIALVLGAMLPALNSFFDTARGPNASNLISASLTSARNYAVANNVTTALIFREVVGSDPTRTSIVIAEQDTSVAGWEETSIPAFETTHLPDYIVIHPPDGIGGPDDTDREVEICFLPSGQLTSMDGSVTEFYIYDYTVSGSPEELEHLYINYYTGAVIEE